jgi:hypothetical protein
VCVSLSKRNEAPPPLSLLSFFSPRRIENFPNWEQQISDRRKRERVMNGNLEAVAFPAVFIATSI